jgi:hypothetical protein
MSSHGILIPLVCLVLIFLLTQCVLNDKYARELRKLQRIEEEMSKGDGRGYGIRQIEELIQLRLPSDISEDQIRFYTNYLAGGPDYLCFLRIDSGQSTFEKFFELTNPGAFVQDYDGLFTIYPKWWKQIV